MMRGPLPCLPYVSTHFIAIKCGLTVTPRIVSHLYCASTEQMTASRSSSLLDKAMENAKTENREGKSHSKTKDEVMSHDNSQKLLKSLYGSRSESRPGSPEQIAPAARPRVSSAEINEAGAMGTQMSMQQIISSGESSHSMMRTVPPLVQNAFELEVSARYDKLSSAVIYLITDCGA